MYSKEELSAIIEEYIHALPFPEEPDTLYEPIVYSLGKGGKRLRPLLAMMACNIFSDDVACAMIYSYRLLEQADPAILPRIFRIFNDTSLKVCEGQQYDMDFEALERVPMEDYLHMISLKTAVLLAGAAVIGAVCGGASQEDCDRIYTFATELGMAFQIRDDILDSYGTQDSLGKKIGGDITEGKKTFLTTAAMEIADEDTRRKLGGLMHNREMIADEKVARVLAIYDSLGVREQAETAVERYTARATEALAALSVSGGRREPMERLALELTKRLS